MFAFEEKEVTEVVNELGNKKSIGIVSCSGCPAHQKKGGIIGINKWEKQLISFLELKWKLITPILCNECLLTVHLNEMADRLSDVDAIIVLSCQMSISLTERVFGYPCVSALKTLYWGILRHDGRIEKYDAC